MGIGAAAQASGGYPVTTTITEERAINRLWGIPFIGIFVRAILAIPHFIILGVLGIGMYVWLLIGWIPILINGKVPGLGIRLLTEYLQRSYRVLGYVAFLLPGGYPALEPGAGQPVPVEFHLGDRSINRLWGIPFVGIMVRVILVIPQMIMLAVLAIVMYVMLLVVWIPILLTGRYPDWAASFFGKFLALGARISAYVMLLPVPYPGFSF